MLVKLDDFPKVRAKNEKCLSCHQLEKVMVFGIPTNSAEFYKMGFYKFSAI